MNAVASIRPLMSVEKLDKALECFQKMIEELQASHCLQLHASIDQSFYMQRVASLALLREQLVASLARTQSIQEKSYVLYSAAFNTWRSDYRKFQEIIRAQEESNAKILHP